MLYFTSFEHQLIQAKLEKIVTRLTRMGESVSSPLEKESAVSSLAGSHGYFQSSRCRTQRSIPYIIDNINKTECFFFCIKEPRLFKTVVSISDVF